MASTVECNYSAIQGNSEISLEKKNVEYPWHKIILRQ
jgi:hypothetical protein